MGFSSSPETAVVPLADLVKGLDSKEPRARWTAAQALGQQGAAAAGAAPQLLERFSDPDADVRCSAARAVGHLGPTVAAAAVPELRKLLSDSDGCVRWGASESLGAFGLEAAEAVDGLQQLLKDEEEDVRGGAASALGKLAQRGVPASSMVDAITVLLEDETWHVRRAAAESLGRCGTAAASAIPALRKAVSDPHPRVGKTAQAALDSIVVE